MTLRRVAGLALVAVASCSKTTEPPRTPAPAMAPAPVESPAPAQTDPLACPQGTTRRGSPPPQGLRTWCELPDGREHGPMQSWHDAQRVKTAGGYFEGRPHGRWQSWDRTGALRSEGEYARGTMVGVWTTYYADGTKATRIRYDGELAEYEAWHPNGQPHRTGRYTGREASGPWKEWDAQGNLVATTEGEDGDRVSSTGVPECDAFLRAYTECMRKKMPPEIQAQAQKVIDDNAKVWKRNAKRDGKESLAAMCTRAHESMARSFESLGCT